MSRALRYVKYGSWSSHAKRVAEYVDRGNGVSEAVRKIVAKEEFEDPERAFRGIRAAYYEYLKRQKEKDEFVI